MVYLTFFRTSSGCENRIGAFRQHSRLVDPLLSLQSDPTRLPQSHDSDHHTNDHIPEHEPIARPIPLQHSHIILVLKRPATITITMATSTRTPALNLHPQRDN